MARGRKNKKTVPETVTCHVRLRVPTSTNYLEFKKSLTRSCYVRLERLKNFSTYLPNQKLDMPLLNDSSREIAASEDPDVAADGTLMENPDSSMHREPEWLDYLDETLLACLLLTNETDEFVDFLLSLKHSFTKSQLNACVHAMLLMPMDYVYLVLQSALKKFGNKKGSWLVSSLIINLIMYVVRDDEKRNESINISCLLTLIKVHDLNVQYLSDEIDSLCACLLVAALFATEGDLSTATDIICQSFVVSKVLGGGKNGKNQRSIYSDVLIDILQLIYVKRQSELARKLATFNLTKKHLAPKARLWSSLALGTLLINSHVESKHIAQILAQVVKKNIQLPEILVRAAVSRLNKVYLNTGFTLFETADTYKIMLERFPRKGPIPKIVSLNFCTSWSMEEFQLGFMWACDNIKNRKAKSTCDFKIFLTMHTKGKEEPLEIELPEIESVLVLEQPDPLKRLKKALSGLEPPLTSFTTEQDFLYITSNILTPYLEHTDSEKYTLLQV